MIVPKFHMPGEKMDVLKANAFSLHTKLLSKISRLNVSSRNIVAAEMKHISRRRRLFLLCFHASSSVPLLSFR